jgi:hypothetical protein
MDSRTLAPPSAAALLVALVLATSPAAASNWLVSLRTGNSGEAQAQSAPSTPTGVAAACVSPSLKQVKVSWTAVARASSYTILKSPTLAGTYTSTAGGVTGTSWTSGTLSNGNVYFKMEAFVGTLWVSAQSVATGESTISSSGCVQP